MLSKTILASGLALALSVPAMGVLASEVLEPVEAQNQEQNQIMVTTKDAVSTQNQGEDIQIRVQERNQVHQDTKAKVATQTQEEQPTDQEQARNRLQLQDHEDCLDPDCPNEECLQNQERATERKAEMTGPDDDTDRGGPHGEGVQDGTGPIDEGPEDGTGNQYGK